MCIKGKFNNLSTQIFKQLDIHFKAKIDKIQTYVVWPFGFCKYRIRPN